MRTGVCGRSQAAESCAEMLEVGIRSAKSWDASMQQLGWLSMTARELLDCATHVIVHMKHRECLRGHCQGCAM